VVKLKKALHPPLFFVIDCMALLMGALKTVIQLQYLVQIIYDLNINYNAKIEYAKRRQSYDL